MSDMENEVLMDEAENVETPADDWAAENGVGEGATIGEEDFYDPLLEELTNDTPAEEEAAPATEPPAEEAEDEAAGAEAPATEPETQDPPVNKIRFRYKYDREERDAELDEADLPDIYERALATDRYKERLGQANHTVDTASKLAAAMGYGGADEMLQAAAENYRQTMLQELLDDGTPQRIAEDYVNRQMGEVMRMLGGQSAEEQAPDPEPVNTPVPTGGRDYAKEVDDLLAIRPDLRGNPLPDEVTKAAVEGGKPLVRAYLEYEAKQNTVELEKLRKENQIYKQNAEAAQRSPVKGTSGGGATDQTPSDPFLEGFNSGW